MKTKKLISAMLALGMVISYVPQVLAKDTQTPQTGTVIGADSIKGFKNGAYDTICFGSSNGSSIKWRVLDTSANNGNESGLFVLKENIDENKAMLENWTKESDNKWENSGMKAYLNGDFYNNAFTQTEKGGILSVTNNNDSVVSVNTAKGIYSGFKSAYLSDERVFLPSASEITNEKYGLSSVADRVAYKSGDSSKADGWWLRSGSEYDNNNYGFVNDKGKMTTDHESYEWGIRPAMNIKKNDILMASYKTKANGGREWTVKLRDTGRTVFNAASSGKYGEKLKINYVNAKYGENEYLSAAVINNGNLKKYERILNVDSEAKSNGMAELDLSKLNISEGDRLYVFSEQDKGEDKTACMSDLRGISVNAKGASYKVTLPSGEGYTIAAASGLGETVKENETYQFTVTINDGYKKRPDFAVKANGTKLNEENGLYTISSITEDQTITVEGVVEESVVEPDFYTVTLPSGDGYTAASAEGYDNTKVTPGNDYKFTVTFNEGYAKGKNFAVKANGESLEENNGVYTIQRVHANQTITVEGIIGKAESFIPEYGDNKGWTLDENIGWSNETGADGNPIGVQSDKNKQVPGYAIYNKRLLSPESKYTIDAKLSAQYSGTDQGSTLLINYLSENDYIGFDLGGSDAHPTKLSVVQNGKTVFEKSGSNASSNYLDFNVMLDPVTGNIEVTEKKTGAPIMKLQNDYLKVTKPGKVGLYLHNDSGWGYVAINSVTYAFSGKYSEDFHSYADGTTKINGLILGGNGTRVITSGSNKGLYFECTDGSSAKLNFSDIDGDYRFSCDMLVQWDNQDNYIYFYYKNANDYIRLKVLPPKESNGNKNQLKLEGKPGGKEYSGLTANVDFDIKNNTVSYDIYLSRGGYATVYANNKPIFDNVKVSDSALSSGNTAMIKTSWNPTNIYKIELETGDYNSMLVARSVEMFNNKDEKIESFKECKGSTVKLKINDPAVVGIDKSGVLIAALYDGDVLVSTVSGTINEDGSPAEVTIPVPENVENLRLKIFPWEDIKTLKPIRNPINVN